MSKGILIFAHNTFEVDYLLMAMIAGGLAKKNLNVSVSLVTDGDTTKSVSFLNNQDRISEIFENIILVEKPISKKNNRVLYDGTSSKLVPFINQNRSTVYDLTPYDRTLLIDSDFFIFSNVLNQYWDVDSSVLISESFSNIRDEQIHVLDKWISEVGPVLRWATTVMFSKDQEGKLFFELVSHIKQYYNFYSDLYRFNPKIYRNDISFSIAKHILDKFSTDDKNNLPEILSLIDRDSLESVKEDGRLIFLIGNEKHPGKFSTVSTKGSDIHIMNKQSILRNFDNLIKLI